MIEATLWVAIGCMCGWIGYLATRTDEQTHLKAFIIVGILGSVVGGALASVLGSGDEMYLVDTNSIFSALIMSGIILSVFAIVMNVIEHTSSN